MALIHFNMATFAHNGDPGCDAGNWDVKAPYAAGKTRDAATFYPAKLNTSQWMESITALGADIAILTAKPGSWLRVPSNPVCGPMRPPGGSAGSGRSYSPQERSSWKLAVAPRCRPRLRSLRFPQARLRLPAVADQLDAARRLAVRLQRGRQGRAGPGRRAAAVRRLGAGRRRGLWLLLLDHEELLPGETARLEPTRPFRDLRAFGAPKAAAHTVRAPSSPARAVPLLFGYQLVHPARAAGSPIVAQTVMAPLRNHCCSRVRATHRDRVSSTSPTRSTRRRSRSSCTSCGPTTARSRRCGWTRRLVASAI